MYDLQFTLCKHALISGTSNTHGYMHMHLYKSTRICYVSEQLRTAGNIQSYMLGDGLAIPQTTTKADFIQLLSVAAL